MKKILGISFVVLLIALLSACCPKSSVAQNTQSDLVTVDMSALSPEAKKAVQAQLDLQKAALEREAQSKYIENEIETYAEWAGKGKEIGTAVSEGLNAVKDVTLELAESDVGKVTIWLIVWKVAGKDFVQIIVGLIVFIVSSWVIISSYRRTFKRKVLVKGGWRQPKEWETVHRADHYWPYPNAAAAVHWAIWLIMICASSIIMFA